MCITRGVRDHVRDRGHFEFKDLGGRGVRTSPARCRRSAVLLDPDGLSTNSVGVPGPPEPSRSRAAIAADVSQDAIELEGSWQSVQASGEADEYGTYLERYPDGIFAPLARDRLAKPETMERPPAPSDGSAVELIDVWDAVKDSDNPAMLPGLPRAVARPASSGPWRTLGSPEKKHVGDKTKNQAP